jgi:transcription elongation factor Elf1
MTERTHYTFELECPRCGKESACHGTQKDPPPKVNCGNCLMEERLIIEMMPTRVWVNQGDVT